MTPPAAATAAGRATAPAPRPRRPAAAPPPRRVSGPAPKAKPSKRAAPRSRQGPAARPRPAEPLVVRLAARAVALAEAPILDRLIRGRLWIGIVAFGLMGIVFMQVSMLKLNTGISRAVATEQTLERQNSALQEAVSRLDGGARIQALAAEQGMVQPAAGQVHYLRVHGTTDARLAAQRIRPPAPVTLSGAASAAFGGATTQPAATSGQLGTAAGTTTAPASGTATATPATTGAGTTVAPPSTSGASAGAVAAPGTQQGTAAGGAGTGQG
jgi:cell division protein FtsL